jgi:hypothetical protein
MKDLSPHRVDHVIHHVSVLLYQAIESGGPVRHSFPLVSYSIP